MLKNTKRLISFLIVLMLALGTVSVSAKVVTINDFAYGDFGYNNLNAANDSGWIYTKGVSSISSSNTDIFIGNGAGTTLVSNIANFTARPAGTEQITTYDLGKRALYVEHAISAPADTKKLVVEFDAMFFANDTGYTTPCAPTCAAYVQFLNGSGSNLFSTAYRGNERTDVGQLKGFGHKIESESNFTYGSTTGASAGLGTTAYFADAGMVTYRYVFTLDEATSKYKVDFYVKGANYTEWEDINSKFTAYDTFLASALPSTIKIGTGNVADSLGVIDNFKVYTIEDGNVSTPVMLDTYGNAITTASAGDSVICATNTNSAVASSLVAGAYDSADYFVGFNNNDLAADTGANFFRYTIPADTSVLKLFTLNSFTDIKPYIDAVSFDIN